MFNVVSISILIIKLNKIIQTSLMSLNLMTVCAHVYAEVPTLIVQTGKEFNSTMSNK